METTATVFIIIIIIIGAIILGVILLSLLKKHYNEIEIFLSLGQSKIKIILQQFLNIAMIAVVALIICLSTGRILNNTIINSLNTTTNNEQIIIVVPNIVNENDENNIDTYDKNTIITSSFQSIDGLDFNVSLDINSITILIISTGIICLLSMIISAIYVGKISPGDILIKGLDPE
ncbi:FtsX-like permease family protein [Coprobacillaceae bacterium CR2/5/TPMF4]|nr:FtsX-like permease family protein [Coprobacillaceae bacterium CR2/5/TPMF4]